MSKYDNNDFTVDLFDGATRRVPDHIYLKGHQFNYEGPYFDEWAYYIGIGDSHGTSIYINIFNGDFYFQKYTENGRFEREGNITLGDDIYAWGSKMEDEYYRFTSDVATSILTGEPFNKMSKTSQRKSKVHKMKDFDEYPTEIQDAVREIFDRQGLFRNIIQMSRVAEIYEKGMSRGYSPNMLTSLVERQLGGERLSHNDYEDALTQGATGEMKELIDDMSKSLRNRRKTMKIDTRIGKGRTRKSAIRKDEEYGILHGRKYNLDGKTFTLDYNERGDEYSLYLDEGKDFPTFIGTVVGDANESDIQDWIDVEYGKYRSKKKTDLYEGQKVEVDGKIYSLYWIEEGRNAPRDKYSVMDDETGESLECEVSDTMTMDEIKDEIRYCVGVNARMGKSKSQLNKSKGIRLKGYNGTWKVIKSRGQFSLLESEQMGKKALNIVLKGKKILKEVDADKDKATKEFFGNNDAEKCNSKTFKADDVEEDVEEDEKQTKKSKIGKRMMMKSFARNFIKSIKLKGSRFVKTAEGVKRHFMLAWDSDSYLANFEFIDEEESPSYEDVRDAVNAYVEEFINSIYEDLSNDSDMTNEVCYEAVGELEQVKWSIVNELTDAYCDYAGITKSKSKIGKRKFSKEESPKSDFKEMEHPETDEKINGKNAVSDEDGKPDIIPEDDEMPSETALPDEMLNHEELEEINSTEYSAQASILDLDPSDAIDKMRNHGMTLSDLRDSLRKQDLGSRSAQVNPSGYPYAKIGEGKLSNVLHRPTGEVRKF